MWRIFTKNWESISWKWKQVTEPVRINIIISVIQPWKANPGYPGYPWWLVSSEAKGASGSFVADHAETSSGVLCTLVASLFVNDGGAAENNLWHGYGGERQRLDSLKLKGDIIVPCKPTETVNSGETGEKKIFKPKNIIHIETTGNTFWQDFPKCFSLSVYWGSGTE